MAKFIQREELVAIEYDVLSPDYKVVDTIRLEERPAKRRSKEITEKYGEGFKLVEKDEIKEKRYMGKEEWLKYSMTQAEYDALAEANV